MIKLAGKEKCTGCMSCYNSCAQGAIEIKDLVWRVIFSLLFT